VSFEEAETGAGVQYELELSEAHAYKPGIGSHFAAAPAASDYHVVCKYNKPGSIGITDLVPGTWHFARLAVVYTGWRFYSQPLPFYTEFAVPAQPERPRLAVAPEMSAIDPEEERTQVCVCIYIYVCACVCMCVCMHV